MAATPKPRLTVSLTFPKLKGVLRLVKSNELYAEPLHRAMTELGRFGYSQAIRHAPVATGRTVAKMQFRVQKRPFPRWVAVKTTAVNPRNKYEYPRRQNYDPKSRNKGWFDKAVDATRRVWPGLLQRAAQDIARKWDRGG